jgi:hypothetical protein
MKRMEIYSCCPRGGSEEDQKMAAGLMRGQFLKLIDTVHFFNYQYMNVKKNTLTNYEFVFRNFRKHFGHIDRSATSSAPVPRQTGPG